VRAAGLLFVSGQPSVDPSTGEAVGSSFDIQARQAFKNLDTVLRAGNSRLVLRFETWHNPKTNSVAASLLVLILEHWIEGEDFLITPKMRYSKMRGR